MSKVVALIPARSGSKGVINKNMREIHGKTLLQWSISACKKSKFIDKTIVSTDSVYYQNHAIKNGAAAPFLRPENISQDYSTDLEFILHALDWLQSNEELPKYIVHIRPTTPFRDPKLIDQAIEKFLNFQKATSLRSIHEMPESAYKTFEVEKNRNFFTPDNLLN